MTESIVFREIECGNHGDVYQSCSDTIEDISTENLLKEIKEKYIPNDHIELKVTDEDINNWLKKVKASKNTIDADEKYLCVAVVTTDGGYDEYELEHIIEDA